MYTVSSLIKPVNAEFLGIYDCSDGVSMALYENVNEKDFLAYEEALENDGYSLFDSTDFAGNIHFTLKKDGMLVQLYRSIDGKMRVIADNYTAEYDKEQGSVVRKCNTELYQFETDHSLIDCGMCYIIRCADNSFFIIDSAHYLSVHDNDRIHDFLRSMTPENEKIRIAGWFISHGHEDHYSKFMDYMLYNCEDTVIERIYLNLVSAQHPDCGRWEQYNNVLMENFRSFINNERDIPIVKLHTGQRFFVRNLEFKVLCTHEDVYPESNQDFNNSSVVLMLETENTKVLIPGDASDKESIIMENRYGDWLKSDIVQLSHHGHNGTSEQFYKYVNADVVLCPNTQIKIDEEFPRIRANRVAKEIAKEFYVSANGTVKLTLPYKLGTAEVFPDETTEDFVSIKFLWGYDYTPEFKANHISRFLKRSKK